MPRRSFQAPTSEQALEGARRRRLRGAIIRFLYEQSPQPLNADILLSVLERLHFCTTPQELAAALAYLESRGYVTCDELRPPRSLSRHGQLPTFIRVKLTADGSDLADTTREDPGIDLP